MSSWRDNHGVEASVRLEQVLLNDPLVQVAGTSSALYFETEVFSGRAILQENPGREATAYGMLKAK